LAVEFKDVEIPLKPRLVATFLIIKEGGKKCDLWNILGL